MYAFEEELYALSASQLPTILQKKTLVHALPCVLGLTVEFRVEGFDEEAVGFFLREDLGVCHEELETGVPVSRFYFGELLGEGRGGDVVFVVGVGAGGLGDAAFFYVAVCAGGLACVCSRGGGAGGVVEEFDGGLFLR